jgi:hypothetical protein
MQYYNLSFRKRHLLRQHNIKLLINEINPSHSNPSMVCSQALGTVLPEQHAAAIFNIIIESVETLRQSSTVVSTFAVLHALQKEYHVRK